MAFTKITAAGIGSTETVTLDGLSVINNESIGGNLTVTGNATISGVLTYEDVTNVDSVGLITARNGVVVGSGITLSKDGDGFFTGIVTATTFKGNIDAVDGDFDGTLEADAITVNGTALNTVIAGVTVTNATNAAHVTVADNESTNENNLIPFIEDASATGNVGLESDGDLTYNPSTGTVTATKFVGDGSGLTGIGGTDFIHSEQINNSGVTTSQAFIPTTGQLSHRNLIINGDMTIAQRSTSESHINGGYQTVDRFKYPYSNNSANLTQQQVDVSSGTTPYTLGFRKSYKLTNGGQSGTPTNARVRLEVNLEAQDIAQSGWNYNSSSSFITLSFWVNSSISMNFYGYIRTPDGTSQGYSFETGTLSANTWTKIVKTIPGHSNLTFDNDAELGWNMVISMYHGTDYTSSGHTLNQWAAYDSNSRIPDQVSTWYTTDNATWEITGLQLEVGPVATPFEHRSHADKLAACQRYYYRIEANNDDIAALGFASSSSDNYFNVQFPVPMRTYPTYSGSATAARFQSGNNGQDFNLNSMGYTANTTHPHPIRIMLYVNQGGTSTGYAGALSFQENSGHMEFTAEL